MITKMTDTQCLNISDLSIGSFGHSIAYVYDGKNKTAKNSAPYFLLYLKDINGTIIPGFVFNVIDHIKEGRNLTAIKGKLVTFEYYCDSWSDNGISLQLTSLALVQSPDYTLISKFIGNLPNVDELLQELTDTLIEESGIAIQLPAFSLKKSYIDFCDGRVCCLVYHYLMMLQQLKTYKIIYSESEYKNIMETFIVFLSCHLDYLSNDCEADIALLMRMTEKIKTLSDRLNATSTVEEIVQYFNGYVPKDIAVRTVIHHFESVQKITKELYLNRTLPLTVCGDAGYGIIKRYK